MKFYTWVTLIFLSSISVLKAQVTVTAPNQTYNQDFNTLDTSGGVNVFNLAGWEISRETYRSSNGSTTNGDVYSFGENESTDRALGGIPSSSVSRVYIGASFKNTSGESLNEFNIQYKGEQWRRSDKKLKDTNIALPDTLVFEYSTNATGVNDASATWKKVSSLNFISPIVRDTVVVLDGNLAANSKSISGKFNTEFIKNSTIYIRWAYIRSTVGVSGSRDGLAVDDFAVTFKYDPTWKDTTGVPCDFDVDAMAQLTNIENTQTSVSIVFNTIQGATSYLITLDEIVSEDHEFGYPTDGETYVDGQFIEDTKVIGIVNSGSFEYSNLNINNDYIITVTPIYECEKSIFYGAENYVNFTTEEVLPPCEDPLAYFPKNLVVVPSTTSAEVTFSSVEEAVGYIVFLDTDYEDDDYDWGYPSDGSTYTAGDYIGATKIAYVGPETSIVVNDLLPTTKYLLSINPIFNCDDNIVYGDFNVNIFTTRRKPIEGCEFEYEAEATITSITNDTSSFNIKFDTISGAASYLIILDYLQSEDHVFGYPTDKTTYNVGDFIDNSQVIGIITENKFEYSGLVPNSEYFVTVFPIYNCNDTLYYGTESFEYIVSELPATPCEDPTSFYPESVSVTPSATSAEFSFSPVEEAVGYIVFLDVNYDDEGYDWGYPSDNVTYTAGEYIGASLVAYVGNETTITVGNLTENTTYAITVNPIFNCDEINVYGDYNGDEFMTTKATSIKQSISNNMMIYPNPISGNVLNIKLNNKTQGQAKVQVFNIVGSEVYSEQRTISSNMQLALPNQLAAGRYTIRIEQDGNFIVGSFAIVR